MKGKFETEFEKKFENIYDVNLLILISDNEDNYYKVNNFNIKLKENIIYSKILKIIRKA